MHYLFYASNLLSPIRFTEKKHLGALKNPAMPGIYFFPLHFPFPWRRWSSQQNSQIRFLRVISLSVKNTIPFLFALSRAVRLLLVNHRLTRNLLAIIRIYSSKQRTVWLFSAATPNGLWWCNDSHTLPQLPPSLLSALTLVQCDTHTLLYWAKLNLYHTATTDTACTSINNSELFCCSQISTANDSSFVTIILVLIIIENGIEMVAMVAIATIFYSWTLDFYNKLNFIAVGYICAEMTVELFSVSNS